MRLIATDLDGTIVRPDGTVSDRTAEVLARARATGVRLVLVTGRPSRWLEALRVSLGGLGTAICSNGAVVVDDDAGVILEATTLSVDEVLEARARVLSVAPDAVFAAETVSGLHLEAGFASSLAEREGLRAGPFDAAALAAEGVVKLLAKRPGADCASFERAAAPVLDGLVSLTHSAPRVALIEMASPGVDKSVTLARHAARLGIDAADVVAFGDMPNDIGMLTWAGTGFAVGSGQPRVMAAADRVIGTVEEDSVARALEELLPA